MFSQKRFRRFKIRNQKDHGLPTCFIHFPTIICQVLIICLPDNKSNNKYLHALKIMR